MEEDNAFKPIYDRLQALIDTPNEMPAALKAEAVALVTNATEDAAALRDALQALMERPDFTLCGADTRFIVKHGIQMLQ